jgi:DNA polymerase III alpha subunit
MKISPTGQSIFDDKDIFELLYTNELDILENIISESSYDIERLEIFSNSKIQKNNSENLDDQLQKNWFVPDEYKNLDIEGYLVHICPKEHYQRLIEELQEYRARNMIDLLRWLKYFVDTCRKNNIVWGVGRGSSVASYVLFLLDVHKIDSIKYKLNWQEFLR